MKINIDLKIRAERTFSEIQYERKEETKVKGTPQIGIINQGRASKMLHR